MVIINAYWQRKIDWFCLICCEVYRDVDVRKKHTRKLAKNLNCEKLTRLHIFLYRFSFTNSCNKTNRTFSVGHRPNFWANRPFIADKAFLLWRFLRRRPRACCHKRSFSFRTSTNNRISFNSVFFCDQLLVFFNSKYANF
mgnify:CR=1 FL=1